MDILEFMMETLDINLKQVLGCDPLIALDEMKPEK